MPNNYFPQSFLHLYLCHVCPLTQQPLLFPQMDFFTLFFSHAKGGEIVKTGSGILSDRWHFLGSPIPGKPQSATMQRARLLLWTNFIEKFSFRRREEKPVFVRHSGPPPPPLGSGWRYYNGGSRRTWETTARKVSQNKTENGKCCHGGKKRISRWNLFKDGAACIAL